MSSSHRALDSLARKFASSARSGQGRFRRFRGDAEGGGKRRFSFKEGPREVSSFLRSRTERAIHPASHANRPSTLRSGVSSANSVVNTKIVAAAQNVAPFPGKTEFCIQKSSFHRASLKSLRPSRMLATTYNQSCPTCQTQNPIILEPGTFCAHQPISKRNSAH
jgi:hypothetical protein